MYTHINGTQTAETPIASWVGCYRFNNSPLSMQVSRCVHSTQDFKKNGQAIKDQNCFSQSSMCAQIELGS